MLSITQLRQVAMIQLAPLRPSLNIHYQLGETYLKEGHIQLALSHFERVNELAKDKPSAFPYLKIVVLQLKNCDKTAASKIYAGLQEAKSFRNTCRVSSALR